MEETLETLGEKIQGLGASIQALGERLQTVEGHTQTLNERMDSGFTRVDRRFDDLESKMLFKFEEVGGKVQAVFDGLTSLTEKDRANQETHSRFDTTLTSHDLRIRALENTPTQPSEEPLRSGPALTRRRKRSK